MPSLNRIVLGTIVLCMGAGVDEANAQAAVDGGVMVRGGVFAPLWTTETGNLSEATTTAGPVIGVLVQSPFTPALGVRGGAEIALGVNSRVRLREEPCASQREMSGLDSCEATGSGALMPILFGGMTGQWKRTYLALDAGASFYLDRGSDCLLADLACAAAAEFPSDVMSVGLRGAVGIHWPLEASARDLTFELGDFMSFKDGSARHELMFTVGVGWW